jgi:hypothetical protein
MADQTVTLRLTKPEALALLKAAETGLAVIEGAWSGEEHRLD